MNYIHWLRHARRFVRLFLPAISLSLLSMTSTHAVSGIEMRQALMDMTSQELIDSIYLQIDSLTISSRDFSLDLQPGRLWLLTPVTIEGIDHLYGAYFEGEAKFRFEAPVETEKYQLRRFFESDSLNRFCQGILLLFSDSLAEFLLREGTVIRAGNIDAPTDKLQDEMKYITHDESKTYLFPTLKNIVQPRRRPFLLVGTRLDNGGRVIYQFDSYRREEVSLESYYNPVNIHGYYEPVCRYSVLIDENYVRMNGLDKAELQAHHFVTDVILESGCKIQASANCDFEVTASPAQLVAMRLYSELKVDSVLDERGNQIAFYRYKKKKYESSELYLFFDEPLARGDKKTIKFFYAGKIGTNYLGEYFLNVGAGWYPKYIGGSQATFNMTFRTPAKRSFISTGTLTKNETIGDTILTKWEVTRPAHNVSFNIGNFEKHRFSLEGVPPVEIHFSRNYHTSLGQYYNQTGIALGRDMERQVANDVLNSLKFYSERFGACSQEKIVVSEILSNHGEAFPGFIHLGYFTWINTDRYGYNSRFRAHEVAHQWFGVDAWYETYHDRWLSEGFAEYAALLYLRAVGGHEQFQDHLKEMRNKIFDVRKRLFSSGHQASSISMGPRATSTKTRGDHNLIVYKKGAYVLHMLRLMLLDLTTLSDAKFYAMMREWFTLQKGKEATTQDFKALTEKYVDSNMSWFFKQWVYGTELPEYEFSYELIQSESGEQIPKVEIKQKKVSDSFRMYLLIDIEIENGGHYYTRVLIDKPVLELQLPKVKQKIKKIRLNPFHAVLAKVKQ